MSNNAGGPRDDEVSITQAAFMLKCRYLKARDFASQGLLGEVRRTETGRYYVQKKAVEELRASREAKARASK